MIAKRGIDAISDYANISNFAGKFQPTTLQFRQSYWQRVCVHLFLGGPVKTDSYAASQAALEFGQRRQGIAPAWCGKFAQAGALIALRRTSPENNEGDEL